MRAKIAASFVLGFSLGAASLAVALWASGSLSKASQPALQKASERAVVAHPIAMPPQVENAATDPDRPIVPIDGLRARDLHDTFHDARNGHEHEALDIPSPLGTPVHAAVEGNVVKLFLSKQGGITVYQFDDSRTYCYYYAHLDHYADGLKEGMLLRQGQVLGYVGATGDAQPNAPHLHFAIFRLGPEKNWWKGEAIDPLPLLHDSRR